MTTSPRSAFGAEFAGAAGFLNSATYGLPPTFMLEGLTDRIAQWQAGTLDVPAFDESVTRARAAYADLVGVPVDSVAMGGSVSALLGLVAAAVPDGTRVATLRGEFTSTTFPFASQAARGVTVTELAGAELTARAADYDVVTVSLVQSATGEVLDVDALKAAVAGTDTLTVVDLTQAVGWKALDLGWADVTVAAVYKWLLAPRGTAWMSLSPRVAASTTPHLANWYAGEEPWSSIYGLPLRLADDARRFDTSPAWFGVYGAGLTMPWLASLDRASVEAHCLALAGRLRSEFGLPPHDSAIVSLPVPGVPEHAAQALTQAGIRASVRAGAVRVGFHLYNTEDDLQRLLDALAR
ncbi:aminotransferase class V-fold PLP-dependent enzyme [Mycobacterium yunnanensis]|uniref:Aminotransferase class V-fold PLP-dependent enzyme n=1 Tax=Mycobacterium yunnanensis TaxID=368477 RepID=A0A9X2Z1L0_9MYCO|nr:aminotransferase class V-fold PLP-dependent enzyme [Mycobacterium yunnanensis]MCV7421245.1 aminotransferase class V-fold PLP-dependent enzyme [Mycobacterium yunnanensis]